VDAVRFLDRDVLESGGLKPFDELTTGERPGDAARPLLHVVSRPLVHSRSSEDAARELTAAIRSRGWDAFSYREITRMADEEWRPRIETELHESTVAILILSEDYSRRRGCQVELGLIRARRADGRLAVVIWNPLNVPPPEDLTTVAAVARMRDALRLLPYDDVSDPG
jgi:hypothetical protein